MNYFHGQLISERDLRTEQAYFRDKLRHYHRCLHGYGVICGLEVTPVPASEDCADQENPECKRLSRQLRDHEQRIERVKAEVEAGKMSEEESAKALEQLEAEREKLRQEYEKQCGGADRATDDGCDDRPGPAVQVSCGAAVDCDGNDLILRETATIDLLKSLSSADRSRLRDERGGKVYLSICYLECGREPTRPLALDSCATTTSCQDARIAEGVRFRVSLEPPAEDGRCEPCCSACEDACLLLAAIELEAGHSVDADDIDHSVRRRFGLYDPTVITGISWRHGTTYSAKAANDLLGTKDSKGGLEVHFSRPVHVDSLKPGVIDIMRITGGRGMAGIFAHMEGEFVDLPADGFVDRVRFRDTTGETVQSRDRIMIVVRAPHILDRCCRPVEGLHIGGKVPEIEPEGEGAAEAVEAARGEEAARDAREAEAGAEGEAIAATCTRPPWRPGPWTSGQNGNFESWFFISEE
jgi:hypothetical protein